MGKELFHTIEKRMPICASVKNAPYKCTNRAWLGAGYYFWDTFIELAHWWGETHYHKNYIITKTNCWLAEKEVFDLVGNTDHMRTFTDYGRLLENKKDSSVTVPMVIEHMKKHTSFLSQYKAIRAKGEMSISQNSQYTYRLNFTNNVYKRQYLDVLPPIQYCVFEKSHIPQLDIVDN